MVAATQQIRFVRSALGALAVLLAAACLGCATSQPGGSSETIDPSLVDARFQPGLRALNEAVQAHDDGAAWRILARLLALRPGPLTLELLESYRFILEGRAAVAGLSARIEAQLVEDHLIPVVVLENHAQRDIEFRPGPAALRIHRVFVDPAGGERRLIQRGNAPEFGEIALKAGERREIELQPIAQRVPPGMLAVRTRLQLVVRAGSTLHKEERYPAMGLDIEGIEHTRLADFLPAEEVEPSVLLEYLGREVVNTPPLMERAVRIASARRAETLDLCTPMLLKASGSELTRAIPALRWLADTARPGGDPRAWREWLSTRSEVRARGEEAPSGSGTLILPGRRPTRVLSPDAKREHRPVDKNSSSGELGTTEEPGSKAQAGSKEEP